MIDDGFIEWCSKYNRLNPVMDTAHIADSAVSTPKIQDLAVAEGKIADGAVTAIKLAADSVTSAKIAGNSVTAAKINWAQMPPHLVCAWQMGTTTEHALYGWLIPIDAAGNTVIEGMRNIAHPLPERAGYTRQYRLYARFAHAGAGGETGWRVMLKLDTIAINVVSSNVSTHAVYLNSGWLTSATIDGWGAGGSDTPVDVVPFGGTDWAGGVGAVTCHAAALEGRYV